MSIWAICLVVVSALLHAGWNLLSKRNTASGPAFFLASGGSAALLLTPYIVWYSHLVGLGSFPAQFWLLLGASSAAQVIYLLGLGFAYKHADIGLVYPIARSLPVLMVGLGSVLLGYSLSLAGWLGFGLITLGCLFVPIESFRQFKLKHYKNLGVLFALIAAIGTAGYSLVDKEALLVIHQNVSHLVPDRESAVFYLGIQFWTMALFIAFYLVLSGKREEFKQAWSVRRTAIAAGVMMSTTYGLVLYAMTMSENVSYVVALRQLSIVFGLVFGVAWLGEKWRLTRGIGTLFILCGLIMSVMARK